MKNIDIVVNMLRERPVLGRSALIAAGVYPATISRAIAEGKIHSPFPGVICSEDALSDPMYGMAAACFHVPMGVIALESASCYHRLSDASPDATQMISPRNTGRVHPSVKLYRTVSRDALVIGADAFDALGVNIRITNPARTVVDLFRTGFAQDTAIASMTEYFRQGYDPSEIVEIAKSFGIVDKIMPIIQHADAFLATF